MIANPRRVFLVILILASGPSARAGDDPAVVTRATKLLEEISSDPESGIPPESLRQAQAIMVMPHIVENQLGLGRRKGRGIMLVRNDEGQWSNPEAVEILELSAGAEAGREVTDLVVIYRTRKAAEKDAEKHAVSFSVSLKLRPSWHGPRKFRGPGPDSDPKIETLVYTRKSGSIVGARFSGERKSSHPLVTGGSNLPLPAEDQVTVKITRGELSASHPDPTADSPEVGQLKGVLASMTKAPEVTVAGSSTKDPKVSQASEAQSKPETAAGPPR